MTQNSDGALVFAGESWAYRRAFSRGKQLLIPNWGISDVLIAMIGAGFVALIVQIFLVKSHIDPINGWGLLISTTTPWLMLAGWPLYISRRKGNGARLDFGLLATPAHIRFAFFAGFFAIAFGATIGLLQQKITGPVNSLAGDFAIKQRGLVLILFALLVIFGAPIVEELAFRGLLFGSLMKANLGEPISVALSAFVFALFHFELSRILILFAIGLVLGEVRRRTGSTLATMVTHFVVNAPGAIMLLLSAFGIVSLNN